MMGIRYRTRALVLTILLLLLSWGEGFATDPDSLVRLLPGKEGLVRVRLLNRIAEAYCLSEPARTIAYATDARNLARQGSFFLEEALAFKLLGDAAIEMDNFPDAIDKFTRSAEITLKLSGPTDSEYVDRTGDIGYCYLMLNRYEQALTFFSRAAELAEKAGNREEMANNYSNIGTIYVEWGDYGMGVEYFQKAMSIDKLAGNDEKISTDLNNIGKMYELWGKYDHAIDYFKQALVLERKAGRKAREAIRLNNLGTAYKAWKKYDTALNYFQQALTIERTLGDLEKVGKRLHHIGLTYFAMGRTDQAKAHFDQALSIFTKMELHDELARLYNSYGLYYHALKKYPEAITLLLKSQELARENKLKPLQISNLETLSQTYEQTGEYLPALRTFRQYMLLKDSVFSRESDKKLAEFRARLENEKIKLDNELLLHDAAARKQANLLIGLGLVLTLIVLLAVVFILRLRARNAKQAKELSDQKAEQYRKDLEIKNNELTYNAMCIVRNNETITRMIEKMEAALNNGRTAEDLEAVLQNIKGMEVDHTWKEFEVRFTQVHKEFYDKLNEAFPDLTPNEKKLCAFLRLNMTTKDIASITHQSVHSINVARTRLRKKLNLSNSEENLVNFLMKF